jgi:hypothetical protein
MNNSGKGQSGGAKSAARNASEVTSDFRPMNSTHDTRTSSAKPQTVNNEEALRQELRPVDDRPTEAPSLSAAERAHLGRKLAAYYKCLLDAPVPEKLTQLLAELERKDKERQS